MPSDTYAADDTATCQFLGYMMDGYPIYGVIYFVIIFIFSILLYFRFIAKLYTKNKIIRNKIHNKLYIQVVANIQMEMNWNPAGQQPKLIPAILKITPMEAQPVVMIAILMKQMAMTLQMDKQVMVTLVMDI